MGSSVGATIRTFNPTALTLFDLIPGDRLDHGLYRTDRCLERADRDVRTAFNHRLTIEPVSAIDVIGRVGGKRDIR